MEFVQNKIKKIEEFIYLKIFNENQIREIKCGILEGINVKLYAKKYFDEDQMREIRYGLEEGLDVKSYAKKNYESSKMREIRLKLEKI